MREGEGLTHKEKRGRKGGRKSWRAGARVVGREGGKADERAGEQAGGREGGRDRWRWGGGESVHKLTFQWNETKLLTRSMEVVSEIVMKWDMAPACRARSEHV